MPEHPKSEHLPPFHPDIFTNGLENSETREEQARKLLQIADVDPDFATEVLINMAERASQRNIDDLTGLPDKRAFEDELTASVEHFRRSNGEQGFDLIMTDLEGFKQLNKRVGHAAGDHILKLVAERFEKYRATDRFFRWGGDEFAVIVPVGQGYAVAERIERDLATIEVGNGPLYAYRGVSSSAEYDLASQEPSEHATEDIASDLFELADTRMRDDRLRRSGLI